MKTILLLSLSILTGCSDEYLRNSVYNKCYTIKLPKDQRLDMTFGGERGAKLLTHYGPGSLPQSYTIYSIQRYDSNGEAIYSCLNVEEQ